MKQLFVIGDSISMAYGPHLESMVAGRWTYARKEGSKDLEADAPGFLKGANGGDSERVLAYLAHRVNDGGFAPDVVLINCGLHDIKLPFDSDERQVSLDQYRANLEQIVSLVPASTQMVWVRTTPVDEQVHAEKKGFRRLEADVDGYNAAADEIMQRHGVAILDLFSFSATFPREALANDGVHFADEYRPQQAAYIAGWLDAHFG